VHNVDVCGFSLTGIPETMLPISKVRYSKSASRRALSTTTAMKGAEKRLFYRSARFAL